MKLSLKLLRIKRKSVSKIIVFQKIYYVILEATLSQLMILRMF